MTEYSEPTQFIDLTAQQKLIRPHLELAVKKVLDNGQYIMGPEVKELEGRLSEFAGVEHTLTCANGTDALSLVLMAWGVGPGDAVFVPSFTYVATAEAPAQLGATPFFVDVIEQTFNIDPGSLKQAIVDSQKIGLKPAVVVAVDLFGQPADIDAIMEIAHSEGLKVLIDGAQSFGAMSKGRRVGCMGDATTTSFFPAKPLGCYGDGGAVFTRSEEDAEAINSIRLHGRGNHKYEHLRIGLNSRLDTLQAAILLQKLRIFDDELAMRSVVASNYYNLLSPACLAPSLKRDTSSAWAQYTIRVPQREELQKKLKASGIPSVVYYPIPLSMQPAFKHFPSVSSGVKVAESLARIVLSLPMHPYLKLDSQTLIASVVNDHVKGCEVI